MPDRLSVPFKIGANTKEGVVVYIIGDTRYVLPPLNARGIAAALLEAANKIIPPEKLN